MAANRDFETLYREQYPRVRRICMGYAAGDEGLARELAQEVFIRVWENMGRFRGESKLSTWIYRIAVNTCLLELRRTKQQKATVRLDQVPEPVSESAANVKGVTPAHIRKLYRCIDGLLPTNRTIILLELEGVPQQEIATITGLTHAAVRTRVHRIKNDLLKQFDT